MDYSNILTITLSAIVSAIVSLFVFNYQEKQKNTLEFQKKRKSVLDKYREFMSVSAYELRGRIDNILRRGLFEYAESKDHSYSNNVKYYTMYLFGQFFAWKEIFRREMQYLDFREGAEEIAILEVLESIESLFSSDKKSIDDKMFMIFRGEQRAIGECMTTFNANINAYECVGYSRFIERVQDKNDKSWFDILNHNMDKAIEKYIHTKNFHANRLVLIQEKLKDLLNTLDPALKRFPKYRV